MITCGGHTSCPSGNFCAKTNISPNEFINFDDIFYSFLNVFQGTTMEGWSTIMEYCQMATTDAAFLYYLPIVFIGGFFLMNLTLAVIKAKFS